MTGHKGEDDGWTVSAGSDLQHRETVEEAAADNRFIHWSDVNKESETMRRFVVCVQTFKEELIWRERRVWTRDLMTVCVSVLPEVQVGEGL